MSEHVRKSEPWLEKPSPRCAESPFYRKAEGDAWTARDRTSSESVSGRA